MLAVLHCEPGAALLAKSMGNCVLSQKCRQRSKGKDFFLVKRSAILATVSRKRENREVALWLRVSQAADDAAEPCSWGSGAATHLRALLPSLCGFQGLGTRLVSPRPSPAPGDSLTCRLLGWLLGLEVVVTGGWRVLSRKKSWERVKRRMTSELI